MSLKFWLYEFIGFNSKIFYLLNSLATNSFLAFVFLILSKIFSIQASAIFMIVYIIIISIHFSKSKIYAEKLKLLEFSVALLINYSAIVIIFTITKSMIALERPLCQLQPNSFILPYPEIEKVCHHSFPSAHSAFATLVAISLWSKVNFFGKLLLIFLVIAVAISRIGLAMHYPADVIYGIFFVFIINYISQKNAKSFAGFLIKLFPAILGK